MNAGSGLAGGTQTPARAPGKLPRGQAGRPCPLAQAASPSQRSVPEGRRQGRRAEGR